mgnify:CR=1 FL=1
MLERLVTGAQVITTICLQYGDTGKGKVSDWLAMWADFNARGTGADNAGHTRVRDGVEYIFHLLPMGIAYDNLCKVTVMGNGMAINPSVLCSELDELVADGGTFNNLRIDEGAAVIMPWHIAVDIAKNKSQANGGIGSTGKGVGPAYADRAARIGLTIKDILSDDSVKRKLPRLREAYPGQIGMMSDEQVIEGLRPHTARIKDYVANTVELIHDAIRQGKKVHIEGAQGALLSVNHGVHPYVTSSDCATNGTAAGVGISAGAIDLVLGLIKAPFMTRVGAGPFVTELGRRGSESYCAETDKEGRPKNDKLAELKEYGIPHLVNGKDINYDRGHPRIIELMNSDDSFLQGVGIRLATGEYGATTKRPRRVGWTDAVAARYAVGICKPVKLIFTKPDSVAGLKQFKICHGYSNPDGSQSNVFSRDESSQRAALPVYKTYEGFGDIRDVKTYEGLPSSLRAGFEDIERISGAEAVAVSVGPEKDQIIVR